MSMLPSIGVPAIGMEALPLTAPTSTRAPPGDDLNSITKSSVPWRMASREERSTTSSGPARARSSSVRLAGSFLQAAARTHAVSNAIRLAAVTMLRDGYLLAGHGTSPPPPPDIVRDHEEAGRHEQDVQARTHHATDTGGRDRLHDFHPRPRRKHDRQQRQNDRRHG